MDQANLEADLGGWLRRTWNAILRTAEAMELSPMEEIFNRLDRLEREMDVLKKREAVDGPLRERMHDVR